MMKLLRRTYGNLKGVKLNRKIVVLESDDWGSIRMNSTREYNKLVKKGIPVDSNYFTRYDGLEGTRDVERLLDVLTSVKDHNGTHPKLTANFVLNNPLFDEIVKSDFNRYCSESVEDSYRNYSDGDEVVKMVSRNYEVFFPQFHGNEHVNRKGYLEILGKHKSMERIGCLTNSFLGLEANKENNYVAAFDCLSPEHCAEVENLTEKGLQKFYKLFGFRSESFIASCGVQGTHLNEVLKRNGVLYHQNGRFHRPSKTNEYQVEHKYLGDKNKIGQIHWRRNVTFEPSRDGALDCVEQTLREISNAFMFKKPAIINTHRVNFIGRIDEGNIDVNLPLLQMLLMSITKRWPDVEFMNSVELGELLSKRKQ